MVLLQKKYYFQVFKLIFNMKLITLSFALLLLVSACTENVKESENNTMIADPHSYAQPEVAKVKHLDLNLLVDFQTKILTGKATYTIEAKKGATKLVLDAKNINIEKVVLGKEEAPTQFELGVNDAVLGQALFIDITDQTKEVIVYYTTSNNAAALMWLDPIQTAGKEQPFLFTQSQAILARTWIPIQDSPGIRFTYSAKVQVPKQLMAVMSATNPTERTVNGVYEFEMTQPIPSYLMALAVGDLEFKGVGDRCGVYAEPSMLEASVYEFDNMDEMLVSAEALYGPYKWDRYDVIVLPPSFPFGGMENPRLTFATPTILAGDRSLTSLIAHELAHSWSGNLVTNATWDDFWLNEGFTVYFERRIMEAVNGESYSEMLALLGAQDLKESIEAMGAENPDTKLKLHLEGRDPDEGLTDIAYEKGNFFLVNVEKAVGRERFDAFLKDYFTKYSFKTMTTDKFIAHLKSELIKGDKELEKEIALDAWIFSPGLPSDFPELTSERFNEVDKQVAIFLKENSTKNLNTENWSTHEWLRFLRSLPNDMSEDQMTSLDVTYKLTQSGNCEIACVWLEKSIRSNYSPAYDRLEEFLVSVGRRKFLTPLYGAMIETGKVDMAKEIYKMARPNYHAVATGSIDKMLAEV
ncbi:MAG: leukotriene-A4 hydrolase [Sphingobacteriales bacterium]